MLERMLVSGNTNLDVTGSPEGGSLEGRQRALIRNAAAPPGILMRRISMLSVGVLSLSLGCSGPTSATVASAASGSWVRVEAHPGSDFEMSLVANGTSLSGTGNFVAEAGPGGTMTIEGAAAGTP